MSVILDAQAYAYSLLLFGGDTQCCCNSTCTDTILPADKHAMNSIQLHVTKGNEVVTQPSAVLSCVCHNAFLA